MSDDLVIIVLVLVILAIKIENAKLRREFSRLRQQLDRLLSMHSPSAQSSQELDEHGQ